MRASDRLFASHTKREEEGRRGEKWREGVGPVISFKGMVPNNWKTSTRTHHLKVPSLSHDTRLGISLWHTPRRHPRFNY